MPEMDVRPYPGGGWAVMEGSKRLAVIGNHTHALAFAALAWEGVAAFTVCPKPDGYEIRPGGGPYVDAVPAVAKFASREDADTFVGLKLGRLKLADEAPDLWHVGELPGDDGRKIRDGSGLEVGEALTRSEARRIVRNHNDPTT